jgi:hypothetical protein
LTDALVRELDARRVPIDEVDDILEAFDGDAWSPETYHGTAIPWSASRPRPRRTLDDRREPVPTGFQEVRPEDLRTPKAAPRIEVA